MTNIHRRQSTNPMNRSLDREQTPAERLIGLLALFFLCVAGFTAIGIVLGY